MACCGSICRIDLLDLFHFMVSLFFSQSVLVLKTDTDFNFNSNFNSKKSTKFYRRYNFKK